MCVHSFESRRLQDEAQKLAIRFERANSLHAVAKQQVNLTQVHSLKWFSFYSFILCLLFYSILLFAVILGQSESSEERGPRLSRGPQPSHPTGKNAFVVLISIWATVIDHMNFFQRRNHSFVFFHENAILGERGWTGAAE